MRQATPAQLQDIVGSRLQYEPFFVPRQPVIRSQQFKKEPLLSKVVALDQAMNRASSAELGRHAKDGNAFGLQTHNAWGLLSSI